MILYYILITSLPYMRHPIWEASLGGGLTVIKLVGGVNVLYAILYLARRHRAPRYLSTPQSRWMILFFALAFFSYLVNPRAEVSFMNPMAMYTSVALLFFVTLTVVDTMRRLYWSLMVATGSLAFASLYLLREYATGSAVWGSQFRGGWVVGDTNYFTVAALVTLPVAFQLMTLSRRRWEKLYCLGCLLLVLAAVTLGASRGGFIGICVSIAYLITRSSRRMRNFGLVILAAIPFLVFAPNSPIHRILHPVPGDTQSVDKHVQGWIAGLNMVKAHPFTGVGLGNYKSVVVQYDTSGLIAGDPHVAHDAYLEIAAEMGIPALIIYLSLMVTTFASLERTRKRALASGFTMSATIAVGIQAGLLGAWVAIFFVSGQYTKQLWFMLIITMCLPALVPKRRLTQSTTHLADALVEQSPLPVGSALVEMH